jgi:hypothetical protein
MEQQWRRSHVRPRLRAPSEVDSNGVRGDSGRIDIVHVSMLLAHVTDTGWARRPGHVHADAAAWAYPNWSTWPVRSRWSVISLIW